jgi:hypothetical protein
LDSNNNRCSGRLNKISSKNEVLRGY